MKYKVITFKTLAGNQELIDLGEQSYGEWIIYENNSPKFHISCFRQDSIADSIINELLENYNWSIEKLLDKINQFESLKLELKKLPFIEIKISSEFRDIELETIPVAWLEKILRFVRN